ncbi:MAG: sulfatase [Candidatus Pacearchaeota archaeon]
MVNLSRRNFLKAGIAAGAAGLGVAGYKYSPGIISERNRDDRPNILMVTMDTTRYDRMGFNGYQRDTTPNLDKIAEQGVVFSKCYAQAPATIFSVSSFMTSKYPSELGITYHTSKLNETTLAEILKMYRYESVGITSVELLNKERGFDRGFNYFSSPKEKNFSGDYIIRSAGDSVNEAKNFIESFDHNKSFFLWLHLFDPHLPYVAPDEFTYRFLNENRIKDLEEIYSTQENLDVGKTLSLERLTKVISKISSMYDGQICYADHQIGKFLDFLKSKRLFDLERDLFIFNADHGELLGEHGSLNVHNWAYEEVIHVPLILAGAGLPKRKAINDFLVGNIDILPTVVKMVDSKYEIATNDSERYKKSLNGWKGSNLLDLISNRVSPREHLFIDFPEYEGNAVRTNSNLKLVRRNLNGSIVDLVERVGFSPSPLAEFSDYKKNGGLIFSWPKIKLDISNEQEVLTNVMLFGRVGEIDDFIIGNYIVPYSEDQLKVDHPFGIFCSEDEWNRWSSISGILKWSVQVFSKGKLGQVFFDSDVYTSGPIQFRLKPTPNFNQLFNLNYDLKEEINLINESEFINDKLKLEELLLAHLDNQLLVSPDAISQENQDMLRALGYL